MSKLLKCLAAHSDDESTQIGCYITNQRGETLVTGWNGFTRGVESTPERQARPEKYLWIEHAERSAIYFAARAGIKLHGSIIYMMGYPCADCARAIVQAGIKEVRTEGILMKNPMWTDIQAVARQILSAGQVTVTVVEGNDE